MLAGWLLCSTVAKLFIDMAVASILDELLSLKDGSQYDVRSCVALRRECTQG